MLLNELISKTEIIRKEITGCNNLIDFYTNKKQSLLKQLEELLNMEVIESR